MFRKSREFWLLLLLMLLAGSSFAIQRFPRPEFETGYQQPETMLPGPRAEIMAVVDLAVLILALSAVSWMVLKKRSRKGVFWVSMFSLVYFGFYREGCICAVGSVQNVTLALFDPTYPIPLTVLAFFIIPLIFTLFFGRTFCAGVCPFGAMQDLVAFRPKTINSKVDAALGMMPYLYLGLAVLFAATGTDFIICRYDPFVGIFRINAGFSMLLFAAILLLTGIFIARPYCRYLCPYGVLLNWISRFSYRHMTITPAECINCRLCENSCPYGAIKIPNSVKYAETRRQRVRKLMFITLLFPFLMVGGGWAGSRLQETFAGVNRTVKLAKELLVSDQNGQDVESFEIKAFRSSGKPLTEVYQEARIILHRFLIGGWILGAFLGLTTGLMVAGKLLENHQSDYVPDKGACLSCARCTDYCPVMGNTMPTELNHKA
ncbi:MAG: 4Fe-4S binding protein [Bacteroidales bacterium]|nr:4Fe-4S binding protein [Bacteroidales bacterium]HNW72352.1 4Fe-4S binding protein [Bacteroidales bacterium]HPS49611.1 4Fe-4S binding protein [Bacteroidales bacterium]